MWDSKDPLDVFDNPNCFFDTDGFGKRREKGDPGYIEWYPPGYVPPKADKKKPFRRKASSHASNQPDNPTALIMSTFRYLTRQNPQGGFTTAVELGEPVADATLLGLIAGTAAVTPVQAEAVLRAFVTHVQACSGGCAYTRRFLGILGFQPTSGGSQTAPGDFHNAEDINAGISLFLTREAVEDWQRTLTLEHAGEVGRLTPVIDSLINQATGALNLYTAGDLMQARGDNLKFDRTKTDEGIFLKPASGPEVRCTVYADIEPGSFTFLIPPGTTGPQTVRMAARITGSLRSFTCSQPITPS